MKTTRADVDKYLTQMRNSGYYVTAMRGDGSMISTEDVIAYLNEMDRKLVVLATALVDKVDKGAQ